MKKLLLLACLTILSIKSFSQSFSGSTSVPSGTTITLTAVGESYDPTLKTPYYYFTNIESINANNITYPSSPANAQQYITITQPNATHIYSPTSPSPTTIKITVYNDSPTNSITVTFKITTQYDYHNSSGATGITGAVDIPYTITIAPGIAPAGTYLSAAYSKPFTRSNCAPDFYGTINVYSVPKGFKNSTVSQNAADQAAKDYVNSVGQSTADAVGSCIHNHIYGNLRQIAHITMDSNGNVTGNTFDLYIDFYTSYIEGIGSDPVVVSHGLPIVITSQTVEGKWDGSGVVNPITPITYTTYNIPAGVSSYLLASGLPGQVYTPAVPAGQAPPVGQAYTATEYGLQASDDVWLIPQNFE
jgi:hypothetical protein